MDASTACIAGMAIYRLQGQGDLCGKDLGPRRTPFGVSETIYLVEDAPEPFYLLPRHGVQRYRLSGSFVNQRANLYALKDLGVETVLSFSAVGAITHNLDIGDMLIVSDLIDCTKARPTTFFQDTGLGVLRQFPVFCPRLQGALHEALDALDRRHRTKATLAVTEGPRLETPAEIRMYGAVGAEIVGHNFAPAAFLAKELQLCFAGLAYVVNYAETGSRYRPFSTADLFGPLAAPNDADRVGKAVDLLPEIVAATLDRAAKSPRDCECPNTMAYEANKYNLPDNWRRWFSETAGRGEPPANPS